MADGEWELVVPFLSVQSRGGPHDDESYVCGFEAGRIDRAMAQLEITEVTDVYYMVHRDNLPTLDLIGMRYGFVMKELSTTTEGDTEWAEVQFTRMSSGPLL